MFLSNKKRKVVLNNRIEKIKNSNYMHKMEENYIKKINVTERFK